MNVPRQQRSKILLHWYDDHGRTLPWRVGKGVPPDPYRVWLSEIMLQQTTVVTVRPYFIAFTKRWPTVQSLAVAELDQVLHVWQGLGYYARARNLHKCAVVIADNYGGQFPDTEKDLLTLPGIGAYTAAAIAAIAFGRPAAPVDGNIERVFARLMMFDKPSPGLRKQVAQELTPLVPKRRPGDFVQALMDLGATVCKPKNPICNICPWSDGCRALAAGQVDRYPVKKPKRKKPTRRGIVFWAEDDAGQVFLRRRQEQGLLGGMMEFPSTDWRREVWSLPEALTSAPFQADWQLLPGSVRHTFTHFHLELSVCLGRVAATDSATGVWSSVAGLADHALPTVMKKVASVVVRD